MNLLEKKQFRKNESSFKFLMTIPDTLNLEFSNTLIQKKSMTIFDPCNIQFLANHFINSKNYFTEIKGEFDGNIIVSTHINSESAINDKIFSATFLTQKFLDNIKNEYGLNSYIYPFKLRTSSQYTLPENFSAIYINYEYKKDDKIEELRYFVLSK